MRPIFSITLAGILMLISLTFSSNAAPSEQWNRTFGDMGEDWISSVQQTTDDGYILAGEYIYFVGKNARGGIDTPFSGSYAWLIKTDSKGNEQWNKKFLGKFYAAAISVLQTPDGGYLFAGLTSTDATSGDNADIWIVKVDENGTQQWNRTFGGPKHDVVSEVRLANDNGYIIAGKYGIGENLFDAWLVRLDPNGNKLWSRTFSENEEANSVLQTADGGYVFAGRTHSYDAENSNTDAYIIKTDPNGGQLWKKTFRGKNDDSASSIQQTQDGGFIITGFTRSFTDSRRDSDAWLIKTDAGGSEQWRRTFGGTSDDMANSVQQTSDGGYIFTGNLESYGAGNADFWLVKTDSSGIQQWSRTFGGKESDRAFSVVQTRDNGYILAGLTYSYGNGSDAWIIKVSGDEPEQRARINATPAQTSIPTPTSMATQVETQIPTDTTMTQPNRSPGFIGIYTLAEMLAIMYLLRRNRTR